MQKKLQIVDPQPRDRFDQLSDDELMILVAGGHKVPFEELVKRHHPLVLGYATRFLSDHNLGREITQEVFLTVWQDRKRYKAQRKFRSYLLSVAFNRCQAVARRRKTVTAKQPDLASSTDFVRTGPLDKLLETEKAAHLHRELLQLNDRTRQAIILRFCNELSYDQISDQSRADVNHVIIDACKSYFLVFQRGTGGKRRKATGHFLPQEKDIPRNTGFLLSTSSAQDSHEWEAFQAGIFSHEVRSALRGAADVNTDGVVTYEEVAAFIYIANRSVPNQRYRPRFLSKPHANKRRDQATLVDLRDITARRIVFRPKLGRRFFIEDQSGIRLADLHPGDTKISVLVPSKGLLFVRDPKARIEYTIDDKQKAIALAALTPRATTSTQRGAEHVSFQRLFREPFTRQAMIAYRSRPPESFDDLPPTSKVTRWLRPALGLFSVAALTTGGIFTGLAFKERSNVNEDTPNRTRQEVNRVIDRDNKLAMTSYIVGATAAVGYLVWRLWPQPKTKVHISSGISLDGQARLQVQW